MGAPVFPLLYSIRPAPVHRDKPDYHVERSGQREGDRATVSKGSVGPNGMWGPHYNIDLPLLVGNGIDG
jgi:hypothetical protein